jgi:hypothetical protein
MGTDNANANSPCPCGKGTIDVEQSSPDHPWVRESQIHYSASLDCPECSKEYMVIQDYSGLPYITYKVDVKARHVAEAALRAAEKEFLESGVAQSLILKVVERIDTQPSIAARHRLLQQMHLHVGSIGTYRKNPFKGEIAVKHITGGTIAYIGATFPFEGVDQSVFREVQEKISHLHKTFWGSSLRRVKTGAKWLAA